MPTHIEGGTVETEDIEAQETADIHDASNYSGADGGAQIQAAMDDLTSRGGTVIVPADGPDQGEWYLNDSVLVPSNTRLVGSPGQTVLSVQSSGGFLRVGGQDNRVSNAVVEGITVNGNNIDSGRISVTNADHVTIRNCACRNGKYSFHVSDATDVVVERCYGTGATDDNYTVTDYNQGASLSRDIVIRDCVSENPNQSCYEIDDGPHNVRVVDCNASVGGGQSGFRTHTHNDAGDEGAPQDIYFVGCRSDGGDYGFQLGQNRLGTPKNYHVIDCQSRGASLSALATSVHGGGSSVSIVNLVVDGLTVTHDGTEAAIDLNSDVTIGSLSDIYTTSNTGPPAIAMTNGADIENVTIEDSFIYGSGNAQIGIDMTARDGATIRNVAVENNKIQQCRQNGIDARGMGGSGNVVRECNIAGNIVRYNGVDTSKGDGLRAGIYVDNSGTGPNPGWLRVMGNQCYDGGGSPTQTYGIYRENMDNSIVLGNILHGHTLGAFGGDGTTTTGVETANVAHS